MSPTNSDPSAIRNVTNLDLSEVEERLTKRIDSLTSTLWKIAVLSSTVIAAVGVPIVLMVSEELGKR
jgi:hypothetical protein